MKSASVTPAKLAQPPLTADTENATAQPDAAKLASMEAEEPPAKRQRTAAAAVAAQAGSESHETAAADESIMSKGTSSGHAPAGVPPSDIGTVVGPGQTDASAAAAVAGAAPAMSNAAAASMPAESVHSAAPVVVPLQAKPAAMAVDAVQPQQQLVLMPPATALPPTAAGQGTAAAVVAQDTAGLVDPGLTPADSADRIADAAPEPFPPDLQTGIHGTVFRHHTCLRQRIVVAHGMCGAAPTADGLLGRLVCIEQADSSARVL